MNKSSYAPRPTTEDRLVQLREASTILARSRSSILRDVDAGRLPKPVHIGPQRRWAWRLSTLRQVIDGLESGTVPAYR